MTYTFFRIPIKSTLNLFGNIAYNQNPICINYIREPETYPGEMIHGEVILETCVFSLSLFFFFTKMDWIEVSHIIRVLERLPYIT